MEQRRPKRMRQARNGQSASCGAGSRAASREAQAGARRGHLRFLVLVGLVCVVASGPGVVGCERSELAGSPVSGRRPPPSLFAPFDVGAVIRRVHFAWRSEEGGFSAGQVEVAKDGSLSIERGAVVERLRNSEASSPP